MEASTKHPSLTTQSRQEGSKLTLKTSTTLHPTEAQQNLNNSRRSRAQLTRIVQDMGAKKIAIEPNGSMANKFSV